MKDLPEDELPIGLSKSQRKRDSDALQELGQELTKANASTLAKCELPEKVLASILEYQALPEKHGAQRRQLQYIGKMMRLLDEVDVERIHSQLNRNVEMDKRRFHRVELLRDRLLTGDTKVLAEVLKEHPQLNAKEVGQLVRQARKEEERGQPPGSARKLFKLLRESLAS